VLSDLMNHLEELITAFYHYTGLAGIALAMAIESCCIPLPSEIVMPLAGIMIENGEILKGLDPLVGVALVSVAGAFGCLVGSMVAYWIGYVGGRPLMLRYGRYLLISQHDADKADAFFQRWGSATAFFSRLLPVIRTYISLPAGIARMPFLKFCVYSFLGSLPWCALLAFVGLKIGDNLEVLGPIFHSLDVVILVGLVVLVVWYVRRHLKNDRKAREAHAAQQSGAGVSNPLQQQNGQQARNVPSSPSHPQAQWQNKPSFPTYGQETPSNPRQPFPPASR
jgi:membrane protein DedA with SNARE-associated domain